MTITAAATTGNGKKKIPQRVQKKFQVQVQTLNLLRKEKEMCASHKYATADVESNDPLLTKGFSHYRKVLRKVSGMILSIRSVAQS